MRGSINLILTPISPPPFVFFNRLSHLHFSPSSSSSSSGELTLSLSLSIYIYIPAIFSSFWWFRVVPSTDFNLRKLLSKMKETIVDCCCFRFYYWECYERVYGV